MGAVTRRGAGAPLVGRTHGAEPWTLLAVCGRDRADLVVPALESIRAAWPDQALLFHRDPADRELRGYDLAALGVTWLREIPLEPELAGRRRVFAMRAAAALEACAAGFQRVLFLDSDILVDPGAGAELERLWQQRPTPDAAVALTRCAVYDLPEYARPGPPLSGATLRTHGLGMALAFACGAGLERAARRPARGSWDSHWCLTVAAGCVVTPEQSWAIHEGRSSGLCATAHPGLDVEHPTPHLAGRWSDGRKAAQRGAAVAAR